MMRAAYKTFLWWMETLWWHASHPVRRYFRRPCGHPCCMNKPKGESHADLPWGECPCLDHYRFALKQYVELLKERMAEEGEA